MKDNLDTSATLPVCVLLAALLGGCDARYQHRTQTQPTQITGVYAKNCPTPPRSWQKTGTLAEPSMMNVIRLDTGGKVTWNGTPVTIENLRDYLRDVDAAPASRLIFIAKLNAQCAAVQAIRDVMNNSRTCRGQGTCVEGEGNLPPPVY